MLLWRVRKFNSGFTLIEMLATIIIIGIIAAIAAPNFLGLLNRNRVNEAARQVEGALREAQRQALRTGKECEISINETTKIISNPTPPTPPTPPTTNGCLLSSRNLNNLIKLDSSRTTITFSGKGNITINGSNPTPVLVVSMSNGTDLQRCVVLDNILASLRTGEYSGTIPDPPLSTSCQ